jgi:hypothetical protein
MGIDDCSVRVVTAIDIVRLFGADRRVCKRAVGRLKQS